MSTSTIGYILIFILVIIYLFLSYEEWAFNKVLTRIGKWNPQQQTGGALGGNKIYRFARFKAIGLLNDRNYINVENGELGRVNQPVDNSIWGLYPQDSASASALSFMFTDYFDDLSYWQPLNKGVKLVSGQGLRVDARTTQSKMVEHLLSRPSQLSYVQFNFKEQRRSWGGGMQLYNSNGNEELAVATDNDQWVVHDADGVNEIKGTEDIYDVWTRVELYFDWISKLFHYRFQRYSPNLLVDPELRMGLTHWVAHGDIQIEPVKGKGETGETLSGFKLSSSQQWSGIYQNVHFEQTGLDYEFEYQVKYHSGNRYIGSHIDGEQGRYNLTEIRYDSGDWTVDSRVQIPDDDQWHLVQVRFKSTDGGAKRVFIQPGRSENSNSVFAVRSLVLRRIGIERTIEGLAKLKEGANISRIYLSNYNNYVEHGGFNLSRDTPIHMLFGFLKYGVSRVNILNCQTGLTLESGSEGSLDLATRKSDSETQRFQIIPKPSLNSQDYYIVKWNGNTPEALTMLDGSFKLNRFDRRDRQLFRLEPARPTKCKTLPTSTKNLVVKGTNNLEFAPVENVSESVFTVKRVEETSGQIDNKIDSQDKWESSSSSISSSSSVLEFTQDGANLPHYQRYEWVQDWSQGGNHATQSNSDRQPKLVTDPTFGRVLEFDGSHDLELPQTLGQGVDFGKISFEATILLESTGGRPGIFVARGGTIHVEVRNSHWRVRLSDFDWQGKVNAVTGRWVNIAFTYDRSTREFKFYRDGQLVASATGDSGTNNYATVDSHIPKIGTSLENQSRQWRGRIANMKLYSRILTPAEVRTSHTRMASGPDLQLKSDQNLVGAWNFYWNSHSTNNLYFLEDKYRYKLESETRTSVIASHQLENPIKIDYLNFCYREVPYSQAQLKLINSKGETELVLGQSQSEIQLPADGNWYEVEICFNWLAGTVNVLIAPQFNRTQAKIQSANLKTASDIQQINIESVSGSQRTTRLWIKNASYGANWNYQLINCQLGKALARLRDQLVLISPNTSDPNQIFTLVPSHKPNHYYLVSKSQSTLAMLKSNLKFGEAKQEVNRLVHLRLTDVEQECLLEPKEIEVVEVPRQSEQEDEPEMPTFEPQVTAEPEIQRLLDRQTHLNIYEPETSKVDLRATAVGREVKSRAIINITSSDREQVLRMSSTNLVLNKGTPNLSKLRLITEDESSRILFQAPVYIAHSFYFQHRHMTRYFNYDAEKVSTHSSTARKFRLINADSLGDTGILTEDDSFYIWASEQPVVETGRHFMGANGEANMYKEQAVRFKVEIRPEGESFCMGELL